MGCSSLDAMQRAIEQGDRLSVKSIARGLRGDAGAGTRVGAFQQHGELETGEDAEPSGVHLAAAGGCAIAIDEIGGGGKAVPRRDRYDRLERAVGPRRR